MLINKVSDKRHLIMSSIKSKGTKPENIVRRWLWNRGFRYRLNSNKLPGHPDLVLRKYRTCIFINGCFWHGHGIDVTSNHISSNQAYSCFRKPKENVPYWENKIIRNKQRDIEKLKKLAEMGWHTITIWECELKPAVREQTLRSLAFTLNKIWLDDHRVNTGAYPQKDEEDSMLKAAEDL